MIAKLLKDVSENFKGDARLYELSEPLEGHSNVVVSAVSAYGRPETFIFGSDEEGNITNWLELPGSFQGDINHNKALEGAGYIIEGDTDGED